MTIFELHRNFKIELDKSEITSYPSFLPEEIDYWFNTAIERFIKTRYSGLNIHKSGFQQDQKRSDDLRSVITSKEYIREIPALVDYSATYRKGDIVMYSDRFYECAAQYSLGADIQYEGQNWILHKDMSVEYPSDYWIGLGEHASIMYTSNLTPIYKYRNDVIEATIENIDSKINNRLSDHILHNGSAKPIRLYSNNSIALYTDGNYIVSAYVIDYIKSPEKLDIYKYPLFNESNVYNIGAKVLYNGEHYSCTLRSNSVPFSSSNFTKILISIMPDHTWDEITVLAVRLAIENISGDRYQTYSVESQATE